ncbi:hypothetical protein ABZ688_33125 [Streptomyces fimicarius]
MHIGREALPGIAARPRRADSTSPTAPASTVSTSHPSSSPDP